MTEASAKPNDIILKFLQEIVESWNGKLYKRVADQCGALLKRRKTIENLGMTVPLQRILLQAYILQEQYEKVLEWDKAVSSSSTIPAPNREGYEDLVLYARYRTGDHADVSKQASAANTNGDQMKTIAFLNLRAQSEFHLNRTEEGLAVYLELLSTNLIADDDIESKMEVLTNALALIASSGCTPMVDENDENLQFWLDEAEAMLLRDDEAVDSMFSDLASNLGCIRVLTDPTKAAAEGSDESWLEEAADTGEDAKGTPEQTNLQWSKHFWYKGIEDVSYEVPTSKVSNTKNLSVTESITQVNQSLLDEKLSRLPAQPHSKWNLLQLRMYWYDRSILQLKAGKYVECQDSCQSLKKTLSSSVSVSKGGGKKKNKETTQGSNSQSPQTMWWEARADVVLAYAQQGLSKHKDAFARLSDRLDALKAAPSSVVVDHAMTHVLLHQFVMEQQQQKGTKKDRQKLLALLNSLPESIQSRPATQLTIDDLQEAVNNSSSNNKTKSAPKSPLEEADMLFGEGRYEEACKLYESALSGVDDSSTDSQLRYVQALAMSGQHEASRDLWQSLESTVVDETSLTTAPLPDGSALENKALPRTATTSARSSLSNKLASNANDEDDENKPSREKILRRRAVRREAYLKELESKGNYNPDRPTKPDPERWIPKNERSRSSKNRNRGGGRNNNKGVNSAQGGGSKLDAERLDAAARRAGKTQASSGPSSANLKVSSGGRKGGRRR